MICCPISKGSRPSNSLTAEREKNYWVVGSDEVSLRDMLTFCWQIANGMSYLSIKNIVHRDLAARNILVCEGKRAKVADFGLSRFSSENLTYQGSKGKLLPLKWMAIESLKTLTFSAMSDVWSYGIVLSEICTLGHHPYPGIDNQDIIHKIDSGYRMPRPLLCSPEIYLIMLKCWDGNPEKRPTFKKISEDLSTILTEMNGQDYVPFADDFYSYCRQ